MKHETDTTTARAATTLNAAREYAARGLEVFPLRGKIPAISVEDGGHGLHDATAVDEQLVEWFDAAPSARGFTNIGIAIPPNVIVVDIDTQHDGDETYKQWVAEHGKEWAAGAPRQRTGNGGVHAWFWHDGRLPRYKHPDFPGIELGRVGRYVVGAPSVHPDTARVYKWEVELPDHIGHLAERPGLPDWLLEAFQEPEHERVDRVARGDYWGNDRLNAAAHEATSWSQLLGQHGWKLVRGDGDSDRSVWKHPGSTNKSSATIKYGCLFTYSPNTPFPETTAGDPHGVTLYGAYAILEHNTDYSRATRVLRENGYGDLDRDGPATQGKDFDEMIERMKKTAAEKAAGTSTPDESTSDEPIDADDNDEQEVPERTSWRAQDLGPVLRGEITDPPPELFVRDDGVPLVYRGKQHAFVGEPESCKGWGACHASAQALRNDEHVLYLDFEDSAKGVVGRLLSLCVPPDVVAARFHYVRPHEPISTPGWADLAEVLALDPALAIIDGVTESMVLHRLDPLINKDAAEFQALLPRALADQGCAVVLVDHVTKSTEGRGRFAIGAQHKLAGLDGASFRFDVVTAFGRGRDGLVRVTVTKDRPGHVREHVVGKDHIAEMHLHSDHDGGVHIELRAPADGLSSPFRPTVLMERISRYIETYVGVAQRGIFDGVPGDDKAKKIALTVLVEENYVRVELDGKAHRHFSVRPFRDDGGLPDVA